MNSSVNPLFASSVWSARRPIPVERFGRYVGRVGVLAAAFGIGVVVMASPGVALAEPSDSSSSSSSSGSPAGGQVSDGAADDAAQGSTAAGASTESSGGTDSSSGTEASAATGSTTSDGAGPQSVWATGSGATGSSTQVAPGVTISSSGGAQTSGRASSAKESSDPEPAEAGSAELVSTDTEPIDAPTESAEPVAMVETPQTPTAPTAVASASGSSHAVSAASEPTAAPVSAFAAASRLSTPVVARSLGDPKSQSAVAVSSPSAVPEVETVPAVSARSAQTTPMAAAVAPSAEPANPVIGLVGYFNSVVTNLLTPFLAPAPNTPDPLTPVVWAVLGWVRRQFFNEAPAIAYNPTTTVQAGQTITGNIGASDPEGDALAYTVTQGPQHGTLTIDQATGVFTYTPDDIDYDDAQYDSFTVSVTDGKSNLVSLLGAPRSTGTDVDLTVLSPTAERVIVNLPAGFTDAQIPRFAADGQSLLFSATPPGSAVDARREIYQVNVDGTGLTCVTCGVVDSTPLSAGTTAPRDLYKPVPFEDGSGRILMQSLDPATGSYTHVVYESDDEGTRLVRVLTPAGKPGVIATDGQREMRISPDGTHVLFTQVQLLPNPLDPPGFVTAVPVVGTLTAGVDANGHKIYNITDARVVNPVGEGKQWTHDGKGVIIQGGLYESGNVDDIVVDIATGNVTRLTGNLDYDEDVDLSPNNQWLAIDSARGLDALTPVTRVERPSFVPLLVQANAYYAYAGSNNQNVSNQPWLVSVEDDLKGENGIPLFISDDPATPEDEGDDWTARSMPSWNADGTAVAFWEAYANDPTAQTSRLVVAKVKYTTSEGVATDRTTPAISSTLPTLSTNVPQHVALPEAGTVAAPKVYNGPGGGTAALSENLDATTGHVVRVVTYTDYVNSKGMILNGTESTDQSAAENTIHYIANIQVTGSQTGSMTGDVVIHKLAQSITPTSPGSQIQSTLDGETLVFLDPARVAAAKAST